MLGFFLRIGLLHFCGYAFWALLYAGFFGHVRPDASLLELELLWLPLCVLMIWMSWLMYHKVSGVSGVYLGGGRCPLADAGGGCAMAQSGIPGMDLACINTEDCSGPCAAVPLQKNG
ncbi:hypothetical protein ACFTAO_35160 [Paenibacillus rhizoplanae]